MPAFCAAIGCKTRHRKGEQVSFHSLPHKKPDLLRTWLLAMGRGDLEPKSHHRICSKHFERSCFYPAMDRPCLRPEAVPTVFSHVLPNAVIPAKRKTRSSTVKIDLDGTAHEEDGCGASARPSSLGAKSKVVAVSKPIVAGKSAGVRTSTGGNDASTGTAVAGGANSSPAAVEKAPSGCDAPIFVGTASGAGSVSVGKKRLLHASPEAESTTESVPPKKRILPRLSGSSERFPSSVNGGNDDVTDKQCPVLVDGQRQQVIPVVGKSGTTSGHSESGTASGHSEPADQSQGSSGTVNRSLDTGASECAPTATAALFLHTYCGSEMSSERLARMSQVLQATRRKLYVVERKLKRKEIVLRQQQGLVDELTRRVSMLEGPTRRFFVSERLPVDLLRDWHENAGRVRHARRYRHLTHQFAAGLYESSKNAYEYVSEWLPLPSLQMMRKRKEQLVTGLVDNVERAAAHDGCMKEEPDHMYAIDGVQMLSLEEAIARGLVQQETVLETTTTPESVDPQARSETALET